MTYAYAVIGAPFPSLVDAPDGLPGARRLHVASLEGGLGLVACEVPSKAYAQPALDEGLKDLDWVSRCALSHEAVVEHFAQRATLVPMKLFTLFASDERAREALAPRCAGLKRVIARVHGRQEWGIRVHLDERRAVAEQQRRQPRLAAPTGTAFLLQKKKARDVVQGLRLRAVEVVDQLFEDAGAQRGRVPTQGAGAPRGGGSSAPRRFLPGPSA